MIDYQHTADGVAAEQLVGFVTALTDRVLSAYIPLLEVRADRRGRGIATNKRLFCILDDEKTRNSGRLIQWRSSLESAEPISARSHKSGVGLVDIGPRRNWLYSESLHPARDQLEQDVRAMIRTASGAA